MEYNDVLSSVLDTISSNTKDLFDWLISYSEEPASFEDWVSRLEDFECAEKLLCSILIRKGILVKSEKSREYEVAENLVYKMWVLREIVLLSAFFKLYKTAFPEEELRIVEE